MTTTRPQTTNVVRNTGVSRKITVNHNTSTVRATGVSRKITVNHNLTIVGPGSAK